VIVCVFVFYQNSVRSDFQTKQNQQLLPIMTSTKRLLDEVGTEPLTAGLLAALKEWDPTRRDKAFYTTLSDANGLAKASEMWR
jgi:hypothetical protein